MEAIWVRHDRTDNAVIVAEGLVETQESHGVLGWLGCPVNPRYFLRDTRLTQASPEIRAMALALPDEDGPLARLHALSTAVSDAVAYRAGVTSADTTAAEAFALRSEEHTSELQSLMRISYAVFCLKKKKDTVKNIV